MLGAGEILLKYVMPIGVVIIALYYVIEFAKSFDEFNKLMRALGKKIGKAVHWYSTLRRRRYDKVLASVDFLKYQREALYLIYDSELKKVEENENKLGYSVKKVNVFDHDYEAVYINFKNIPYPFNDVIDKENGCDYDVDSKPKLSCKKRKYKKLIKRTIRKPKKIGYMLDELDPKNAKFKVKCGTYEQNLYSSHYLEYELYLSYKKKGREILNSNLDQGEKRKRLLELLPERKRIVEEMEREGKSVFTSGLGRYSLLGVQALVMIKNSNDNYDVLRIRRDSNVAAKPGFIQFIPSGGFETFENKDDFDTKYANLSLNKALFRELMEECFGIDEEPNNYHISSEHIYAYPEVMQLVNLIKDKKATFSLLGSTMSLVSLRHELSFIIKIEDENFSKHLSCNYESNGVISSIDVRRLSKKNFWMKYSYSDEDLAKLNCTSAALLNLADEDGYIKLEK
ncbi:MAG: hypothetical protein K6G48_05900 [Acholeplasmatales bacterium]|nr:hypothetical protein [Acholeplasmatales bacterium]